MRGLVYSDSELKITEAGLLKGSRLAKKGSLLILVRGSMLFNKIPIGIVSRNVAFNQDVKSIVVNEQSSSEYILYWFLAFEPTILNIVSGTGIGAGKLDLKDLKDLEVNIPNLIEQKKVSAFLSLIENRIQTQKKIIEKLETLMKASRENIFSQKLRFKNENDCFYSEWKSTKLKNITQIFDGTHQTPEYVKKGIPFYSVENVTANNFSNTKYISEEVFIKENNRVKIERGDILMTRIGDIGTVKHINWDVKASFYVSLALIKKGNNHNSQYLSQYISSEKFQNELWNRTIHVAFPKKINLGEIGECLLQIPCMEEQTKIANFLFSIQEKIEIEKQILKKLELQKKFLLANLFV